MPLLKRTYALPQETIELFEKTVTPEKRSVLLASLMREWLEARKREQLRCEVIAGCQEMAAVYLELERDFNPLEEEVQHALATPAETRRSRARATRSRRRVGTSR